MVAPKVPGKPVYLSNYPKEIEERVSYWTKPGTKLWDKLIETEEEGGDIFEKLRLIRTLKYKDERVDSGEFLDRKVRFMYNDGQLKDRGFFIFNGHRYGHYSQELIDAIDDAVTDKSYNFTDAKYDRARNISETMEFIFYDLMHYMFPGFDVILPHESDDLFNGADVLLVKRDSKGNVVAAFSLDMFFTSKEESLPHLVKKLMRGIYRASKRKLGLINFAEVTDKIVVETEDNVKVEKIRFSARDVPNFVMPIDYDKLQQIAEEYYKGGTDSMLNSCDELREVVLRQLDFHIKHSNYKTRSPLTYISSLFKGRNDKIVYTNLTSRKLLSVLDQLDKDKAKFDRLMGYMEEDGGHYNGEDI